MTTQPFYRPGLLRRTKVTDWLSWLIALGISACALGLMAQLQQPVLGLALFLGLGLAVLLWQHPVVIMFLLFGSTTIVELYQIDFPDALTELIPVWRNLTTIGIAPIPVNPAELLMVLGVAIWLLRGLFGRTLQFKGSALLTHYSLYLALVLFALLHGIAVGGNTTIALWEVRAPMYAGMALFLALNLLRTEQHLNVLSWLIVAGTGIKGIQGTWRYLVTYGRKYDGMLRNSLLEHDEAFFFPAFYIFVLLLFIFQGSRRQKQAALLLFPFVMIADVANKRRASTANLVICLLVLLIILFKILVQHRGRILQLTAVGAILAGCYVGAFWNSNAAIAQPVRAIKSNFEPDPRDESSNHYRDLENEGLMNAIRRNLLFGQGYGIEMPLVPGMADVRELSPFMLYMPHNSILWVWWRTGTIGFVLFWAALGSAIIRNCLLARSTTDPMIRRWAIFAVALVVMHMLMGWLDVGLFSYRQIMYIWIVLAVPDVLCRLNERPNVVPVMIGVRA